MAILLVDDNAISLDLQKLMLESYGMTVETATSGRQAVELVRANDYAMLFVEVAMADMDGFETAAKIREFNGELPIVGISADELSEAEYTACGMNAALGKPMQLRGLRDLLEQYVAPAEEEQVVRRRKTDPVFDYESLLGNLGNDTAVMMILRRFLTVHSDDCSVLESLIDRGNFKKARALLGDLIVIAGDIYCSRLYEAAYILSAELVNNRYTRLPVFVSAWRETRDRLDECCNAIAKRNRIEGERDGDDMFGEFCELWRDFDTAAVELFFGNRDIFVERLSRETLEKLDYCMTRYDFLTVMEILEGYNV